MPDIIRLFSRAGASGTEKMLITQKNLKKCIKLFDTELQFDYNKKCIAIIYIAKLKMKGGIKMEMNNTCIRLNKETIEKFKQLAIKKKRKTSELMRIILENYIEKQEIKNNKLNKTE